jgi:hypothetical protein
MSWFNQTAPAAPTSIAPSAYNNITESIPNTSEQITNVPATQLSPSQKSDLIIENVFNKMGDWEDGKMYKELWKANFFYAENKDVSIEDFVKNLYSGTDNNVIVVVKELFNRLKSKYPLPNSDKIKASELWYRMFHDIAQDYPFNRTSLYISKLQLKNYLDNLFSKKLTGGKKQRNKSKKIKKFSRKSRKNNKSKK